METMKRWTLSITLTFATSLWCTYDILDIHDTYEMLSTRQRATTNLKHQIPFITHTTTSPHSADMVIYLVDDTFAQNRFTHPIKSIFSQRDVTAFFESSEFNGAEGQQVTYHTLQNNMPTLFMGIGLGSLTQPPDHLLEKIRQAMGNIIKTAHSYKKQHIALIIDEHILQHTNLYDIAREITTTALIAQYHFDEFLTRIIQDNTPLTLSLVIKEPSSDLVDGIEDGYHIGAAVNQARYWSDLPPCVCTPRYMAYEAERIAQECNLDCTIFDEEDVKHMGCGGIYAVSQGSYEPCRFIILEYRAPVAYAPTIALVGKGVTFDSGGISIKPSANMEDMKFDMAGAAAVIATMQLVAYLQPLCNVIALTPFTENMPSGTATKPSDIITFYNGVTAEVKNTDAEGRLILADALAYAVEHYQPSLIIDIATLTGACLYALGKPFAGILSEHDVVAQQLIAASKRSGDYLWRLPLTEDYMPAIQSHVADIANLGSPSYAGATTAACFLKHFVGNVPWAHLDIAGPAWDAHQLSYYKPGATGFGVRLFAQFLMNYESTL